MPSEFNSHFPWALSPHTLTNNALRSLDVSTTPLNAPAYMLETKSRNAAYSSMRRSCTWSTSTPTVRLSSKYKRRRATLACSSPSHASRNFRSRSSAADCWLHSCAMRGSASLSAFAFAPALVLPPALALCLLSWAYILSVHVRRGSQMGLAQ